MLDILMWILSSILIIIGIIGTILPALPGIPVVFLGFIIAAWIDKFERVGWAPLVVLGVLSVSSILIDLFTSLIGAKKMGASKYAAIGAFLGTIIGLFFSLPGLILGPFIGAVCGEYIAKQDLIRAGKVGVGTFLGLVIGVSLKLALVFFMIGFFILSYIF